MIKHVNIKINGIVQGVGFRPFVHNIANELGINGWVRNIGTSVEIEAQGKDSVILLFIEKLRNEAPPMARVQKIEIADKTNKTDNFQLNYKFQILESSEQESLSNNRLILPDLNVCEDCLAEMNNPNDRRYEYPFINCTNCGPRFSIITDIPYDRKNTTMDKFVMCEDCLKEYNDPTDRRFHAQPVACPACGPQLRLLDNKGMPIQTLIDSELGENVIEIAVNLLKQGNIIAIKGLGGFHLACDALNLEAVKELRIRKKRDGKPFALMADSIDTIKELCNVSLQEEKLLSSIERPIVLLERHLIKNKKVKFFPNNINEINIIYESSDINKSNNLNESNVTNERNEKNCFDYIAADTNTLGIMLPYTPLQYLLLKDELKLLVMTSGNVSGEPVCYKDDEAIKRLSGIADYFIVHNREINTRTDDSVYRSFKGRNYPIRRSKGFVPLSIGSDFFEDVEFSHSRVVESSNSDNILREKGVLFKSFLKEGKFVDVAVLAFGGELKNVFCIMKNGKAFLSHHIGDLENLETLEAFESGIEHFKTILDINPKIIACDLHPDYMSTKYAVDLVNKGNNLYCEINNEISEHILIKVQHHHAHIASCMAENELQGDVIGIAFDGTGYGDDGNIWGGEFLIASYTAYERYAHFDYVMLPGGDKAVREPWRMAVSYLRKAGLSFEKIKRLLMIESEQPSVLEIDEVKSKEINSENLKIGKKDSKYLNSEKLRMLKMQLEKGINCPLTSSIGRLFDGVSALLGLCYKAEYEGQAAILLEAEAKKALEKRKLEFKLCLDRDADKSHKKTRKIEASYEHTYNSFAKSISYRGMLHIDFYQMGNNGDVQSLLIDQTHLFQGIVEDLDKGVDIGIIALKFHYAVAELCLEMCEKIKKERNLNKVALSGGVFQNMLLLEIVVDMLEVAGFEVYTHSLVPTNDGGISLGQAIVALKTVAFI
jgi:hydrogenase maturation protein HypF